MPFKLSSRLLKIIENKISSMFDSIKYKLLGPRSGDKSLYITTFDIEKSIPKIYEEAIRQEGGIPNIQTLNKLTDTSKNYIDSLKLKTINTMISEIEKHAAKPDFSPQELEENLVESWKQVTSNLEKIVKTETQVAKNIGLLEGIVRNNARIGIEDPTIAFICVPRDQFGPCPECTRLHLMEDEKTPRLWKLSELSRGYHKKGNPTPSILGCHPNDRCVMVTILPSFGFNEKGKTTYIKKGFDALKAQRASQD